MESYHFTEFPWPHLPPEDEYSSMRVNLPSSVYDPKVGADLYDMYLDQHLLADDLGLNIMLNEHHQTATCLNPAAPLACAILARQTTKARICLLGNPIANLADPIRCAEEMAMVDNISRGRLDCGFVRGVPYELLASNANPTTTGERMWEAIDLIVKAWTTHDGPFNYESRFIHKRQINVWPRPYQEPHPPIWITGGSDLKTATKVVERGYVFAMFLTPFDILAKMFKGVRENCRKKGLPPPGDDQFAFMPLVATADTEEEAEAVAKQVFWYVTHNKSEPQFRAIPGYIPNALYADYLTGKFSGGRTDTIRKQGISFLKQHHVAIYGTPDQVYEQIKDLYEKVGGFGHFLAMMHSGAMDYDTTAKSMTLFAKEVMPRLKELGSKRRTAGKPLKQRARGKAKKPAKARKKAAAAA